jgi:hypothetical protein
MSTVDSSALAITNIFTKEIVVNGIYRIYPHFDTHRFMVLSERGSTGIALTISLYFTIIFLPERIAADPLEAKLIMNRIGFYQMGLIAQNLPSTMLILYGPICRPVPMILANISSLITLPALSVGLFEQKYYSSNVPEAPPNIYLHPVVVSTLVNLAVMMLANATLPESIAEAFSQKSEKEKLTYDMILQIMSGTVETVHSPLGRAMYVAMIVFSVPFVPWYGKTYSGCDYDTYKEHNEWKIDNSMPKPPDCDPEKPGPCNSFSNFGSTLLAGCLMLFPITSLMQVAWIPDPAAGEVVEEQARAQPAEAKA